ncbi:hypothetical protein C8K30_108198 [Promicromonospora sp. AC04]|uniref:hypothetical protein n=1 Tax=Promicromonospora sp. AC04 TaxID=2135723 RepID=UPI000D3A5233|nr:hypothetical protein [Promicromonospora sp. AC04]PUB24941.1 hypothetical protein C8K30_108198 [Promicromonospora sp. AC04]
MTPRYAPLAAHGVGSSQDLPLPFDLVLQAGAVTVVVSFLAISILWRVPRAGAVRHLPAGWDALLRSRWWRIPLRTAVLALALYVVGNALFGPAGEDNPAAHLVFVWLWVGLVPMSILFGPVWRGLNPLRTLHAILCRILRIPVTGLRPGAGSAAGQDARHEAGSAAGQDAGHEAGSAGGRVARSAVGRGIGRTGHWPAAVALLAFVWLELVAPDRTDPRLIGVWLSAYALVQLGFGLVRGEQWFARGDAFEMYSELAGRMSVLGTDDDGRFVLRSPLAALTTVAHPRGTTAFVAVWWGSTIFDSASGSPVWAGFVQSTGAPELVSTAGLVGVCLLVAGSLWWTMRRADIALPLVPIAAGYTLAHYASLLIVEGPRGLQLLVQPWVQQPGTAGSAGPVIVPDPAAIAVVQVACIVVGHLVGVLAAHDRALRAAPGRQHTLVIADELPGVLLMVGYTWAGLFLLFAA